MQPIIDGAESDAVTELYSQGLRAVQSFNFEESLTTSADGMRILYMPLPYYTVNVGNAVATTDANGSFSFYPDIVKQGGNETIRIAHNEFEIIVIDHEFGVSTESGSDQNGVFIADETGEIREQISVTDDGQYEIVIKRTYQDLEEAVEKMGQAMAEAQSEYRPSYFFPNGYTLPQYFYQGDTYFYTYWGIVGCNKCNDAFFTGNELVGLKFGSDCANSILLGLLYLDKTYNPLPGADPSMFWRSVYCVDEAMDYGTGLNLYCNGSLKSGHYNCSWFPGIEHSESFHTHDGSSTIYT
jgi:predicted  nucleic acid-binding Zn-ribbon protein